MQKLSSGRKEVGEDECHCIKTNTKIRWMVKFILSDLQKIPLLDAGSENQQSCLELPARLQQRPGYEHTQSRLSCLAAALWHQVLGPEVICGAGVQDRATVPFAGADAEFTEAGIAARGNAALHRRPQKRVF